MFALLQRRSAGYLASVLGIAAIASLIFPFYESVRSVTLATLLLMVVLLTAMAWGTGPALVSSLLATLCVNVFYTRPSFELNLQHISGEEFVGLASFLVTAILVGQLSSRAQHRARKVQELYDQLRTAFDRASELEAIKRSEHFKSALLDTVTHDLRTPLTSIKAAATALINIKMRTGESGSSRLARGSQKQLLDVIVQQSDRLNQFIEGMIELAKTNSAAEPADLSAEATPLEEIIGAALARAEDVLRKHQVSVECEEDVNTAANPKAIAQVVFSLLENAARYAPPGTMVRVIATRDGREEIQVAVEDEGPGVPLHLREKIFTKFFHSDAPDGAAGRAHGLGLGLAIARGILGAHGGRIWVEDRRAGARGARFVFTVPPQMRVGSEPAGTDGDSTTAGASTPKDLPMHKDT